MRSFYGGASNQGAAMPGKMPADVLTPGKSSPRGYLDYAARADTSLAKGVAILRQLPSRNGSLRRPCDWSMNRPAQPQRRMHAGPMSGAVPLSGELDGWTQQMRTIAESSCLRISLISHSQPSMKVLTLLPPIFNIMCHDYYAPLGAIVFSPWQAKVNANGLFLPGLLRAPPREVLL